MKQSCNLEGITASVFIRAFKWHVMISLGNIRVTTHWEIRESHGTNLLMKKSGKTLKCFAKVFKRLSSRILFSYFVKGYELSMLLLLYLWETGVREKLGKPAKSHGKWKFKKNDHPEHGCYRARNSRRIKVFPEQNYLFTRLWYSKKCIIQ